MGDRFASAKASAPPVERNGLARERVADIQRARVLGAAVELIGERGLANVTVAHIVERSGVSRRTFYEQFTDREDCFLAALEEAATRAEAYVLDGYDASARWEVRVRGALTGLLTFLDVERRAGQLLIVGSLGAGAAASERRGRVLAQMTELIDEGRLQTRAGAEPPPLTAEGVVGGVLSVLHSRLAAYPPTTGGEHRDATDDHGEDESMLALAGPLMSMIVLPYLGAAAARRELTRPLPAMSSRPAPTPADPLRDLPMRLTYRTVRVLTSIAVLGEQGSHPSNREIGIAADMQDQGQISKLLTRLAKLGLIENGGAGLIRGAPNAWRLTPKGREVERAVGGRAEV